ncbi:MAG: single-stranded DNA-binding protein [Chloroflexi bacterium]|nr:single-stranded DNA-binding protein [Chloroflexota bacterium]
MSTRINAPANQVRLAGKICLPPRMFVSRAGKPQLLLCLAIERQAHMSQKLRPDGKPEPDYPRAVIEGQVVGKLVTVLQEGDWISGHGILATRNYDERGAEGQIRKRTATEVIFETVTLPRHDLLFDETEQQDIVALDETTVTLQAPIRPEESIEMDKAVSGTSTGEQRKRRRKRKNRLARERAAQLLASLPTPPKHPAILEVVPPVNEVRSQSELAGE